MNLINEVVTVCLLLIVINIISFIISDFLNKKTIKNTKENIEDSKESKDIKIKNIKNICILLVGMVAFATIIDIYNIIIKNENAYIHVFGFFKFAKINLGFMTSSFIFSIGQFIIYIEIILLLLVKSNKKKVILTVICILIYLGLCIYKLYSPYMFMKKAQQYEYLDNYDIIADFKEDDKISEKGALKIVKDEFKCDYIANVTAELVNKDDIEDPTIKYSNELEDFWIITFDYMNNYEIKENICVFVDLYTGEVSYLTYEI